MCPQWDGKWVWRHSCGRSGRKSLVWTRPWFLISEAAFRQALKSGHFPKVFPRGCYVRTQRSASVSFGSFLGSRGSPEDSRPSSGRSTQEPPPRLNVPEMSLLCERNWLERSPVAFFICERANYYWWKERYSFIHFFLVSCTVKLCSDTNSGKWTQNEHFP